MAEAIEARTIALSRVLDAPRPLVYRVWTDPNYVSLWWGVEGSCTPVCEMDVRVGGTWRIDMRTAGGTVYPNGGTYLEVIENERLVYDDVAVADSPAWRDTPRGPIVHVVTFEDVGEDVGENQAGAQTRVSMTICAQTAADRDLMVGRGFATGVGQSLDRLNALLRGMHDSD